MNFSISVFNIWIFKFLIFNSYKFFILNSEFVWLRQPSRRSGRISLQSNLEFIHQRRLKSTNFLRFEFLLSEFKVWETLSQKVKKYTYGLPNPVTTVCFTELGSRNRAGCYEFVLGFLKSQGASLWPQK